MSKGTTVTNVPETNPGGNSGVVQRPAEVFGEHIQVETRLVATAVDTEKPNPEAPGENTVLPAESMPTISNDLEEQAAGAQTEATSSARRVSDRKLAANRENAKHSTGPKTAEGKATSSQNSYKHGILSYNLLRPGEQKECERAAFEAIVDAIAGYYQPVGFMENFLVEKITAETVRFTRLLAHEQQELSRKSPFWGEGLDRVLRYQATINRQLFQAMEQLDRLQSKRKGLPGSPKHPECEPKGGVSESTNTDARLSDTSEGHPQP